MKKALRPDTRQLFLVAVTGILCLVFFAPVLTAEPTVRDTGDLDPDRVRSRLAQCEAAETRLRSSMAQLTQIWNRKEVLKKEYYRVLAANQALLQESVRLDKAFEEAEEISYRLERECYKAWKGSGFPERDWSKRWHELKECRDWQSFQSGVYGKRKSVRDAKVEELKKSDKNVAEVSDDFSRERQNYFWAGANTPSFDSTKDPQVNLRNVSLECGRLRALAERYGYDQSVRAKKAIEECKFAEADRYLAEMPSGDKKVAIQKRLGEARARAHQVYLVYQEGKAIYNKGKTEEVAGRYDQAKALYQQAHAKFSQARDLEICERRLPTIYKALSIAQKRIAEVSKQTKAVRPRSTKRFDRPMMGGVRIDGCLTWAKDCGKPAADEFCRRNHFSESVGWATDVPVPESRIITSGAICKTGKNWPRCGAFSYIECR